MSTRLRGSRVQVSISSRISTSHGWNELRTIVPRISSAINRLNRLSINSSSIRSSAVTNETSAGTFEKISPVWPKNTPAITCKDERSPHCRPHAGQASRIYRRYRELAGHRHWRQFAHVQRLQVGVAPAPPGAPPRTLSPSGAENPAAWHPQLLLLHLLSSLKGAFHHPLGCIWRERSARPPQ